MTPDERNLLTGFLNDLAQARAGQKDPEAEALIKNALSANPDAAYLLVQHTILSDQALHAAQAQIQQLQAQAQSAQQPQPSQGASFFGGARPSTSVPPTGGYGAPPPQAEPQQYSQPQYQPYGGQPPQPQPFSSGGGLGSFLRSAGTMAAGVAGGEFLASGLSSLFGGHRGFGGFGGGFGGGGFGGAPVENVTINEYNDDNSGGGDDGDWDDGGDGDFSDDSF
jgi:hypothetical protein